ncbi:MAG: thioredoxin family protein, partial [Alphaproteobacteria bacterium]|nr:thioredoxin family protein [Alphaproteobacteria bacterium]
SDFKGKTVVLEWTNHDCPFVRKFYEAGKMQEYQKAAVADGVVWLSIISSAPGKEGHVDGVKANELTASRNAAPSHVLLDETGTVGKLYGAKTTPHMFIIDASGVVQYHGAIDSIPSTNAADIDKATNYVTAALADLKAGKAVAALGQSRPYGCSVKYGE